MKKIVRKLGVDESSSVLFAIGKCGTRPADEKEILSKGYDLGSVIARGSTVTFTYVKEDPEKAEV